MISKRLRFVAPSKPPRTEWVTALLSADPDSRGSRRRQRSNVAHRRRDHRRRRCGNVPPPTSDAVPAGRCRLARVRPRAVWSATPAAAMHTAQVHKGNALDGARIKLENTAPFGRRMRGVSYVFATKDRPGHLRSHGRPTKTPGKTFIGTFVVDDSETVGPDFAMRFFAPKEETPPQLTNDPAAEFADIVHDVIVALPEHRVCFGAVAACPDAQVRPQVHQRQSRGRYRRLDRHRSSRRAARSARSERLSGRYDRVGDCVGRRIPMTASMTASCVCVVSRETTRRRRHTQTASESTRRSPTQSRNSRISSRHHTNH